MSLKDKLLVGAMTLGLSASAANGMWNKAPDVAVENWSSDVGRVMEGNNRTALKLSVWELESKVSHEVDYSTLRVGNIVWTPWDCIWGTNFYNWVPESQTPIVCWKIDEIYTHVPTHLLDRLDHSAETAEEAMRSVADLVDHELSEFHLSWWALEGNHVSWTWYNPHLIDWQPVTLKMSPKSGYISMQDQYWKVLYTWDLTGFLKIYDY